MIIWDLRWRHLFFIHQEPLFAEYFSILRKFNFSEETEKWFWRHNKDDLFSVASVYLVQDECVSISKKNIDNVFYSLPAIWDW